MSQRAIHIQEVAALEASAADRYCYVSCKSASGADVDVRLPIAEARKLYELLRRRFSELSPSA